MKAVARTQQPRPRAILWDMDGTLIDQTAAIIACYRDVIVGLGYPRPDEAVIRRSLGGVMAATMELFVPTEHIDEACRAFRARFPQVMFNDLIVLPGAMELIQHAYQAHIPQAIFTNKHGETARLVSQHLGFSQYIPICIGSTDTQWHKPQSELTRHVLQQLEVGTEGAVVIGDSPTDVAVAHNAGLRCYAVATGAHRADELIQAGADAAYATLMELGAALNMPTNNSTL